MPIRRVFEEWSRPALVTAADYLVRRYCAGGRLDLQNVVVALPGNRACRRLLELLVQKAEELGLVLLPGQILTAGALPELLYEAKRPFADELTQTLAWVQTLKSFPREKLHPLSRRLPESDDLSAWMPLGEMLSRLHRELAADAHDFERVLQEAAQLPAFDEHARWALLAELQRAYLGRLDQLGLWDKQTARLFAIEHRECRIDRDILLVGMVDINQAQRLMLDQVADHVTALIFAPAALADHFDEHGCVSPEKWLEREIPLPQSQMEIVDGPSDQADAVLRVLASYEGRYAADEITIGVPDEQLVSFISQRLGDWDLPVRYGVAQTLARSSPWLLLQGIAAFLDERSRASFAAVLRHPLLLDWIRRRLHLLPEVDILSALDRYICARFPSRLVGDWLRGAERDAQLLARVVDCLDGPKGIWRPLTESPRPLGEWAPAIRQLCVTLLGDRPLNREQSADRAILKFAAALTDTLREFAGIPAELQPRVTGAEALRMALRGCGSQTLAAELNPDAIELLGWLELPWDDAPALIVTGFNEGRVPTSRNSDLFLPNELRRLLHLEDNDRVYARDAYALSLLCASRQTLHVIAGRRTADNDPLIPSRLLFACPLEELPDRTLHFFPRQGAAHAPHVSLMRLRPGQTQSTFLPPHPSKIFERCPLEEVRSMRVTEFRDFISCPYRYLLRHRLKLSALQDRVEELGGDAFGTLLHGVLNAFGLGELRQSRDAEEIRRELSRLLIEAAAEMFGEKPPPAVAVQIEHARLRLDAFAEWQARWAAEGWEILYTEADVPDGQVTLDVDGDPIFLRGRIDRIDFHHQTGRCFILDYKTGDKARTPAETHRRKEEWIDLQLPLYRHLLKQFPDVLERVPDLDSVQLGYVLLPKSTRSVRECAAGWNSEELAAADEKACEIVRAIRRMQFWPLNPSPSGYFDDLVRICGNAADLEELLSEFDAEGGDA